MVALGVLGGDSAIAPCLSFWSPLNFLPLVFLAVLAVNHDHWVQDHGHTIWIAALLLAAGLAYAEWLWLVSASFFGSQGVALPLYARLSLVAECVVVCALLMTLRPKLSASLNTMAFYALGLFCVHPFLIGPMRQWVGDLPSGALFVTAVLVVVVGYSLSKGLMACLNANVILGSSEARPPL